MNWFKRWRKELLIIFGVIALAVGGVIVANELGKTGDIALDDDFTSSFIDQDVKVDEGFHFFESKNGKYTMWLPAGYYLVGERGAYESKDHYESMNFYEERDDEKTFVGDFLVTYKGGETEVSPHRIERRLERLLKDFSYNNEYQMLETDDTIIYYGASHASMEDKKRILSDPAESYANRYFALVHNKEAVKVITIEYSIRGCLNDTEGDCNMSKEREIEEAQFFDTFIRNIKFH